MVLWPDAARYENNHGPAAAIIDGRMPQVVKGEIFNPCPLTGRGKALFHLTHAAPKLAARRLLICALLPIMPKMASGKMRR